MKVVSPNFTPVLISINTPADLRLITTIIGKTSSELYYQVTGCIALPDSDEGSLYSLYCSLDDLCKARNVRDTDSVLKMVV